MNELNEMVIYFQAMEKENTHTAVVVLDSSEAQRLVAIWSTIPLDWKKPKRSRPKNDMEMWDWLWEGVVVDWATVAKRANIDPFEMEPIRDSLIATRMIYPDGQINGYARAILSKRVANAVGWPGKKKDKPKEDKEEKVKKVDNSENKP